jgi:hypothetical protein
MIFIPLKENTKAMALNIRLEVEYRWEERTLGLVHNLCTGYRG